MAESFIQRSFEAGEIAPGLYGRADLSRYAWGLKTCRNFFVMRHGGVANRAGSQFIAEVKTSSVRTYLLKFVFSDAQAYIIEAGQYYFRFYQEGARIVVSAVTAWSGATAYVVGNLVSLTGVNYYCILAHTNHTPANATYWYPLTGTIFEIPTPYLAQDVIDVQVIQSGDVATLLHPLYPPMELKRLGDTNWTLTALSTAPSISAPATLAGVVGTVGTLSYRYMVTAVKEETYEESTGSSVDYTSTKAITGATAANPVVITATAHGFLNGEEVLIEAVGGMIQINNLHFIVWNVAANSFELLGINGSGYTAYTSGGTAKRNKAVVACTAPTQALPNTLTWAAVSEAQEYNVYLDKDANGIYGFIGIAKDEHFYDIGFQPDFSVAPPIARVLFASTGEYPSAGNYYQQRLLLANTANDQNKVYASRSANFRNFTISSPIQDDDAVTFSISAKRYQEIRHLIEVGKLVILTSAGEWTVEGDVDGVLRPTAIDLRQHAHSGAAKVIPIVIGSTIIYVQDLGSIVRDLSFESGVASGRDLTRYSAHMFDDYLIERMDYSQTPHSIAWFVRDDGVLVGLTYIPDEEVWGWHRHDTDGIFEDVSVIPEFFSEDALYVIVKRTIGGSTKRYIERFPKRRGQDQAANDPDRTGELRVNALFSDSFLTYDGRNTSNEHLATWALITMTLTTGGLWTPATTLTLTASASFFTAGDVGNVIVLIDGTTEVRITITGYSSVTVVTGTPNILVPALLRTTPIEEWERAVDDLAGLSHLEGKTVSVLADGVVLDTEVVTAGAIAIAAPASVIHVGLPVTAEIQLLDLDVPQIVIRDKRKLVRSVSLVVETSQGILVGPDEDNLKRVAATQLSLTTGVVEVLIPASWNGTGSVLIRQTDPLPLSILSAIPNVDMGG